MSDILYTGGMYDELKVTVRGFDHRVWDSVRLMATKCHVRQGEVLQEAFLSWVEGLHEGRIGYPPDWQVPVEDA
jgi:hypothetical protein